MAVKYHCPKCNKRYMEWGAEKLGFKCPSCSDEKLVLVGLAPARAKTRKPAAKKKKKKAKKKTAPAQPAISTYEDEDKGQKSEFPDDFEESEKKANDAEDGASPVLTGNGDSDDATLADKKA